MPSLADAVNQIIDDPFQRAAMLVGSIMETGANPFADNVLWPVSPIGEAGPYQIHPIHNVDPTNAADPYFATSFMNNDYRQGVKMIDEKKYSRSFAGAVYAAFYAEKPYGYPDRMSYTDTQIKNAAAYWDRIVNAVNVPQGMRTNDAPTIANIDNSIGAVTPVPLVPSPQEIANELAPSLQIWTQIKDYLSRFGKVYGLYGLASFVILVGLILYAKG